MRDVAAVLALNGGYTAVGAGFLLATRAGPRRVASADFALLAYSCGVAGIGIVAAQLALIDLVPGLIGTWIVGAIALAAGWARKARARSEGGGEFSVESWERPDVFAAFLAAAIVGTAAAAFWRLPLQSWDGWAIWATKAHALYSWGGVSSPALRTAPYNATHLDYPLLLPSLEAGVLRTIGRFDGAVMHIVLASALAAFAAGLLVLLRGVAPSAVRAVVVVGAVGSPTLMTRLASNYADVPLAFFVALGMVAIARWTARGADGLLILSALFFGAATLTKTEGTLFAAIAFAVAALFAPTIPRARLKVLAAAIAVAVMLLPWRIFAAAHHLTNSDYSVQRLSDPEFLSSRASRASLAASTLLGDVFTQWEVLWIAPALAIAAALSLRRFRLPALLTVWAAVSFAGLVFTYWISLWPIHQHLENSGDRVISSIVLSAFCVSALIIGDVHQVRLRATTRPRGSRRQGRGKRVARLTKIIRLSG